MTGKSARRLLGLALSVFLAASSQIARGQESDFQPRQTVTASVVNFTAEAKPGQDVILQLQTLKNVKCDLFLGGGKDSGPTKSQNSDNNGMVTFKFPASGGKASVMPVIVAINNPNGHQDMLVTSVSLTQIPNHGLGGPNPDNTNLTFQNAKAPFSDASLSMKSKQEEMKGPELRVADLQREVHKGDTVTVSAMTDPKATATLEVPGIGQKIQKTLTEQKPDPQGKVSWTFAVPLDYKANKVPLIITANGAGGQSKRVISIEVPEESASLLAPSRRTM